MGLHDLLVEKGHPSLDDKVKQGAVNFLWRYEGRYPLIIDRETSKVYYLSTTELVSFYNIAEWADETEYGRHSFSWDDVTVVDSIAGIRPSQYRQFVRYKRHD